MQATSITLIFFIYGLSFFTMGVVVAFELGRCADTRFRVALRYLAAFGILHGLHEWLEMFYNLGAFAGLTANPFLWNSLHNSVLAFSFLPLSIFGVTLLAYHPRFRRLTLLVPLTLIGYLGAWLAYLPGILLSRQCFLARHGGVDSLQSGHPLRPPGLRRLDLPAA